MERSFFGRGDAAAGSQRVVSDKRLDVAARLREMW
jgi:hypothetical protein